MIRRTLSLFAVLALATSAAAQQTELSVQTIYGSSEFGTQTVSLNWTDDGKSYTTVERNEGVTDLYRVDARSAERELVLSGADLVPPGAEEPISIGRYQFSADGSRLLIMTDVRRVWRRSSEGTFYVWDFGSARLMPTSARPGGQRYAKLAPDASKVAFVRENNIYVTDLASGEEAALTTDGSPDIINGTTDWVYEEELSLVDGFRWSPDGGRIAFWRFDQSAIPPFYLTDQMALYPGLVAVPYPKAGTENSTVKLGVIELESGDVTWIDSGSDEEYYLARMDFANSANEIWIQRLNRHQSRMDLLLADARTGASRVIMTDRDDAWLDIDFNDLTWLDDGARFLYTSERDGYAHIYMFGRDGSMIRQLTSGEWEVLGVYGVDEDHGRVYFTAAADGPLVRPLYSVGLDGTGFERMTGVDGSHRVSFDPTFTYYVDTYSEAGLPPVQTLREIDGTAVRTLADNSAVTAKLEPLGLVRPEFTIVPGADGTELNAWIIKPPDFDPTKSYPLLLYVYGGPGSQTVTDSWGGSRYLWHQLLAARGYLVASVDNRGTGARGARFKKVTYLNLGKYEVADQIAAARHFASLPYVDGARIGIWGWSYGGYMAAFTIFKGADVFKAAIAGAPVTDWRLYDTIYTERYMRTPQENPDGYQESAPQAYAELLDGNLLIIHGTGDDNVHPQNTFQLVERLIEANKQFQLRLYPNEPHGIRGAVKRVNLYTLMTEFILENL
jgi:dipeptidyl-peptidase-4